MDTNDARTLALELMAEHNLDPKWTFGFDNATTRLGLCNYRTSRISISRHFTEHADEAQVRDTVLHEVAHALTGPGHGHGLQWKITARRIGATPKACADNPFIASEGEVAKRLAKVEGQPFYRVQSPKYADKRYRIVRENEKTFSLVDEEGGRLTAGKSLVYPDGEKAPSYSERQQAELQRNIDAVKGRVVVRINNAAYAGKRYGVRTPAGTRRRRNHLLVNLSTGAQISVPPQMVRLETREEAAAARATVSR